MKIPDPIELAFFHPNSGTFALVTLRPVGLGVPTVRVNVSIRNDRGIDNWIAKRWISTWHKWFERAAKEEDAMRRPLPPGWRGCDPEDVPG